MQKIIISGSMSFIDKMSDTANQLMETGYRTVLPEGVDWSAVPAANINERKKELSIGYFNEIAMEDTYAVLVVNEMKRGIANYIGASTFAEIAIAFYFGKKIYLLNDIYDPYNDELSAWGVIPLHRKLSGIYEAAQ